MSLYHICPDCDEDVLDCMCGKDHEDEWDNDEEVGWATTCPDCGGSGEITLIHIHIERGRRTERVDCPNCYGYGIL